MENNSRKVRTLANDLDERGIKNRYYHHTLTEPPFIFEARGPLLTGKGVCIVADMYLYKINQIRPGQQIELSTHYADFNLSEKEVDKTFRSFLSNLSRLSPKSPLRTKMPEDRDIKPQDPCWYSLDDGVIDDSPFIPRQD